MYSCKIICDSISETGKRLTTMEITFPRIVLAELNTHRMFSRNSASSRAIPFKKQIDRVKKNPFIPEQFPINCVGMQPQEYVKAGSKEYELCVDDWLAARDSAIESAADLQYPFDYEGSSRKTDSVHKQILNRLLEPFMWHTVIVTATEFDNFFKLRTDENAQYEIRRIADLMYEAYYYHEKGEGCGSGELWGTVIPEIKQLKIGEWHLPFISDEDKNYIDYLARQITLTLNLSGDYTKDTIELEKKVSVARCARVSYLTHDGKRDIEKDLELFEKLRNSGHWSPFEHCATPYYDVAPNTIQLGKKGFIEDGLCEGWEKDGEFINYRSGNFLGWRQMRKEFQDENCTSFRKEQ